MQSKSSSLSNSNYWFGAAAIFQYKINERFYTAARVEYFQDKQNVIIQPVALKNGFNTSGASINLDYLLTKELNLRIEYRILHSTESIFLTGNKPANTNHSILAALACLL